MLVILEVLIGLSLVYLLLSLVCSSIREAIAGVLRERAQALHLGIRELLADDESLVAAFYEHPQVAVLYKGVYKKDAKLPSYISTRAFALALLDMAARGRNVDSGLYAGRQAPALTAQTVRENVGNLANPFVQRAVLSAVDISGGDFEKMVGELGTWFNSSMDRITGWYKRRTQRYLLAIGFVLTVVLDVDTVRIARQLYSDPAKRALVVAVAEQTVQDSLGRRTMSADSVLKASYSRLETLGLPGGWDSVTVANGVLPNGAEVSYMWRHAVGSLFGWLLTAFAISFGAPFWFDALSKLISIRSSLKPKEKPADAPNGGTSPPGGATAAPAPVAAAPPARGGAAPVLLPGTSQEWASGRKDSGIV